MRDVYKDWESEGKLQSILLLVRKWREDGAGLDEIADKLDISRTTLFKYQKEHPDFADALKRGREIVDSEVENSLKKECRWPAPGAGCHTGRTRSSARPANW